MSSLELFKEKNKFMFLNQLLKYFDVWSNYLINWLNNRLKNADSKTSMRILGLELKSTIIIK